jgi:hypothetical protein
MLADQIPEISSSQRPKPPYLLQSCLSSGFQVDLFNAAKKAYRTVSATGVVQQKSTATLPDAIDQIRLTQTRNLHQRPALTSMQLVHTEAVIGESGLPDHGFNLMRGR